jgi:hypothetical protein
MSGSVVGFQNKPATTGTQAGCRFRKVQQLVILCLVLEISILFSFLQSKLSNKVIFLHEPGLLYNLVICFENNMLFRKTDLVFAILNLRLVILLKNERSAYIIIWLQSSVVLQGLS